MACSMEGTRPILMEIQALGMQDVTLECRDERQQGLDYNRVNLLMAVLGKTYGNAACRRMMLYVNIAGGIRLNEPADRS